MGTATMDVAPRWHRFTHANGGYAASWDWRREILMFVHRGGTVYYDLAELREGFQKQEMMMGE